MANWLLETYTLRNDPRRLPAACRSQYHQHLFDLYVLYPPLYLNNFINAENRLLLSRWFSRPLPRHRHPIVRHTRDLEDMYLANFPFSCCHLLAVILWSFSTDKFWWSPNYHQ